MHILIIEDDLDLVCALQQALKVEGIGSEWIRRTAGAPVPSAEMPFDCVLPDLSCPAARTSGAASRPFVNSADDRRELSILFDRNGVVKKYQLRQ